MERYKAIVCLLVISLFTHLLFFGQPKAVVFDEVYTGSFISSYSQNRYYFDIHPPLGKLLSVVVGDIAGIDYGNTDFSQIGNTISDNINILRILPLIAGILLPLVIYLICKRLDMSETSSLIAGFLICIENSLIVQTRFVLFDGIMILFGFISLLLYLEYTKRNEGNNILVYSSIFLALSYSIKWTGLGFLLLIVILEIIRTKNYIKILKLFVTYILIGITVYALVFLIHFSFFPDVYTSFVHDFIQLNIDMLKANTSMMATHPYSSVWYTWPLMLRPVFYWQNIEQGRYIYLLGNPLIYWSGFISVLYTSFLIISRRLNDKISTLIIGGFIVNFLPFAFIGRVMFIYHYEIALVFSVMAIAFLIDRIKIEKNKVIFSGILLSLFILTFIFFSPLTYGLHLSDTELQSKMWISSWR